MRSIAKIIYPFVFCKKVRIFIPHTFGWMLYFLFIFPLIVTVLDSHKINITIAGAGDFNSSIFNFPWAEGFPTVVVYSGENVYIDGSWQGVSRQDFFFEPELEPSPKPDLSQSPSRV